MTDLFWPGDQRAGELMSDGAFLTAMVAVEQSWLDGLLETGIAPAGARADLSELLDDGDAEMIAAGADSRRQPRHGPCRAVAAPRPGIDGALVASRIDQPGRRRHRADAVPA